MVGAYRHSLAGRRDRKTRLLSAVSSFQGFLCKNFQFCLPEWPRSMSVRPNGGMQIVTTPSATRSDPWLSMQSQMHTQGAKTTPKQRSPGRATTRADDQSRFLSIEATAVHQRLGLDYIADWGWCVCIHNGRHVGSTFNPGAPLCRATSPGKWQFDTFVDGCRGESISGLRDHYRYRSER